MGDLNTAWIPFSLGQQQVWDKDDDVPAGGGYIEFYKDDARTTSKNVFVLSSGPPDYTYESAGSVITLSSIGTLDLTGSNFVPYLYPYDAEGNIELYYYKVFNSVGQLQYEVEGVPNVPIGETPTPTPTEGDTPNLIQNGQFVIQNFSTTNITTLNTNFAYPIGDRDGWHYIRSTNACTTDKLVFYRFNDPINSPTYNPTGNPRYAARISCTVPDVSDTLKAIEYRFSDVNRFSDPEQKLSIFFTGASNLIASQDVSIYLYKYFGSGGSAESSTPIGTATLLPPAESSLVWTNFTFSFDFGSNYTEGKTVGPNDDDYCSIQIRINNPETAVFDMSVTDAVFKLGEEVIDAYPLVPNDYNSAEINTIKIADENLKNYFLSVNAASAPIPADAAFHIAHSMVVSRAGIYLVCIEGSAVFSFTGEGATGISVRAAIGINDNIPIAGTNVTFGSYVTIPGVLYYNRAAYSTSKPMSLQAGDTVNVLIGTLTTATVTVFNALSRMIYTVQIG